MTSEYRVVVLGLGYVGLTLAAVYARAGFSVLGVDTNKKIIESLQAGVPHFHEKGLPELLAETKDQLTFSTTITPEEDKNTIFVIAVGTSLNEIGELDTSHLEAVTRDIGAMIKSGDLVILRSTVVVGTTRDFVINTLEEQTGLICGKDIHVAFAPERTVEGKAIAELKTLPQVVAATSPTGLELATNFFTHVCDEVVPVATIEAAEMVKLISNSYRDITFAFANSVALTAAEHNIDVQNLIKAANHGYERNRIPLPSPGVGGYCLTKDPYLFAASTKSAPEVRDFMTAGRNINNTMPNHVAKIVRKFLLDHDLPAGKVAIVGLAFKGEPATSDVRFSPSLEVVKALRTVEIDTIAGHDPHVAPEVFAEYDIAPRASLSECAAEADVVVLMHGSQRYKDEVMIQALAERPHTQLIVDTWGLYEDLDLDPAAGIVYANLSYISKR